VVNIKILEFVPQEITVPVGTRVAWRNDGGRHQIVADNGAFTSPPLTAAKQQFAHTFRRTGVFSYHCSFHGGPSGKGMAGVVKVVERTP
jgi:plastocyanin